MSKDIPAEALPSYIWIQSLFEVINGTNTAGELNRLADKIDKHSENIREFDSDLSQWARNQAYQLRQEAKVDDKAWQSEIEADDYVAACVATMSEGVH